jgi:hypothetical protein
MQEPAFGSEQIKESLVGNQTYGSRLPLRWAVTEANRRMAQHYSPSLTQRLSGLLASLGSSDEVAPIDITTFGRKTAEIIAGGCMNQRTSNVAVPKLKRTRRAARPS